MTTSWVGHVVVGVDGSSYAFGAVDWAAEWAAMYGMPLGLIGAFGPQVTPRSPRAAEELRRVGVRHADSDLSEARRRAESVQPGLEIRAEAISLGAAAALTEASESAALLVIGNRGLGAIKSVVLGGVADEVVTYASCPVVTVPHGVDGPGDRDLVVGMDGSEHSLAAAEFAVAHAARSGATVVAIWAWDLDLRHPVATTGVPALPDFAGFDNDLRDTLESRLAPIRQRYPRVPLEARVVRGHAASVLLAAAEGAGLLVVGSRGHGGFMRLLLGSTSHAVLRAAECAVAVVR